MIPLVSLKRQLLHRIFRTEIRARRKAQERMMIEAPPIL